MSLKRCRAALVAIAVAITCTGAVTSTASGDPVIAAAGDIACDPGDRLYNGGNGTAIACRQRYTSDLLVNRGLTGVLALGDIQYEDATLAKFQVSYVPSWGRVKSITHPVAGNHEYQTYGAGGYFDFFNGVGVRTGMAGDRLGGGHYSFDIGSWHLIALNSNCNDVLRGCGAGSPQEQWLRRDLASNPRACTLAFWHHPLFTSGSHQPGIDSTRPLFQALYDYGADVVLTGHDHNYERFAPQTANAQLDRSRGIRQFVVGTGGKILYPQGTPLPNSEVRNDDSFGVLELTLHPTSYEWRFVPAAGSSFTDSGSAACNGGPGHARPKSAAKITLRLVPGFEPCTTANTAHGPPLVAPSCSPATGSSRFLTAGRPDANSAPTRFGGFLKLVVRGQSPINASDGDQSDVKITASVRDVRRGGDLVDYTGQLQGQVLLRITDRTNGASLADPTTLTDLPVSFTIPCQATPADPMTGSVCNLTSSIDTVLAGAVSEGRRSVWEVRRVSVSDGGPDGVVATADNTEFARPGLFIP